MMLDEGEMQEMHEQIQKEESIKVPWYSQHWCIPYVDLCIPKVIAPILVIVTITMIIGGSIKWQDIKDTFKSKGKIEKKERRLPSRKAIKLITPMQGEEEDE